MKRKPLAHHASQKIMIFHFTCYQDEKMITVGHRFGARGPYLFFIIKYCKQVQMQSRNSNHNLKISTMLKKAHLQLPRTDLFTGAHCTVKSKFIGSKIRFGSRSRLRGTADSQSSLYQKT